jgi:hypothetical protein
MPEPRVFHMRVWQGQDITFLARIVNDAGDVFTSDDVGSWSLRVFDTNDRRNGRKLVTDALPSTYFFDELQTDSGWTRDATGWNFKYTLEYDTFRSEGGHQYRYEFAIDTEDDGMVPVVFNVQVAALGSV